MKDNKIIWGIIGCGDVAEVKSGPAFQKVIHSELLAVMRRNGVKAKDFAQRHNVAYWYDNADQLLRHPEINAIYIATPPSSHVEYALRSIDAGKAVYIEKPIARSSVEARQIAKSLKGKSTKLTVAHYRRKVDAFLKVKQILDSGAIGALRLVDIRILQPTQSEIIASTDINWRLQPEISGGGYFHDLAPHQIDLMVSWFGKPVKIKGFGANQQGGYPANDIVQGIMEFPDKVQFRGVWAFNVAESDQMDSCTIYGNKGSIEFSFFGSQVNLKTKDSVKTFHFTPIPHVQQPMIEATVQYFLGKGENPCPVEDAILGMEIMEAFTQ